MCGLPLLFLTVNVVYVLILDHGNLFTTPPFIAMMSPMATLILMMVISSSLVFLAVAGAVGLALLPLSPVVCFHFVPATLALTHVVLFIFPVATLTLSRRRRRPWPHLPRPRR